MELIKWKWRLCSCHEWPKFELDFSQTSVNSIDCTWICVNASKSKWQNRIIITLLWHLCMPGEGHSQTRDYRAGHTLPAKWSQGNNLAASEAFFVGFIQQYFPVQLQVDRGIQKSTKQLPPTSSTHRKKSIFHKDVGFGIHLVVVDSYKMLPKDILYMSLVWKPLRNAYFVAKNN